MKEEPSEFDVSETTARLLELNPEFNKEVDRIRDARGIERPKSKGKAISPYLPGFDQDIEDLLNRFKLPKSWGWFVKATLYYEWAPSPDNKIIYWLEQTEDGWCVKNLELYPGYTDVEALEALKQARKVCERKGGLVKGFTKPTNKLDFELAQKVLLLKSQQKTYAEIENIIVKERPFLQSVVTKEAIKQIYKNEKNRFTG